MEKIWDLYIDKKLAGSISIRRAYSNLHNMHFKWIIDPKGLTIQQWVDECCEQLQREGHNLDETPLDEVKIKFVKYDIDYRVPEKYTNLVETKSAFSKRYNDMVEWQAPEEILEEMKKSMDAVESGIKELLR